MFQFLINHLSLVKHIFGALGVRGIIARTTSLNRRRHINRFSAPFPFSRFASLLFHDTLTPLCWSRGFFFLLCRRTAFILLLASFIYKTRFLIRCNGYAAICITVGSGLCNCMMGGTFIFHDVIDMWD
jgi:hypothetical protein